MSWKEKQKRNYENINKGSFSVTGEYDIPILEPVEYKYCDWIGFNYASSVKDRRGKGIHFFLEDYQFTRLWGNIDYYVPKHCRFIITIGSIGLALIFSKKDFM